MMSADLLKPDEALHAHIGNAAVAYVNAGLALVPIPRGLKKPITPGWSSIEKVISSAADASVIDGNVGLAHAYCMPTPTCAIDVDDFEQAKIWLHGEGIDLDDLLTADDAVQISSGRANRAKLLYRLPMGVSPLPTWTHEGDAEEMIIEFRCGTSEGTTVQDVLPPSIHPDTGRPYEWGGNGHYTQLPEIPDALLQLWRKVSTRSAGKRSLPSPGNLYPSSESGVNQAILNAARPSETAEEVGRVRSALAAISADCHYKQWRNIVFSIRWTNWTCAEQIAREWSKTSETRWNESAFNTLWKSADPNGGFTLGTVFKTAGDAGWIDLRGNAEHSPQTDAPDSMGDVLNGRVFAALFRHRMLFAYPRGSWLRWDGLRWAWCEAGEALEATKAAAAEVTRRAAEAFAKDPNSPATKRQLQHAQATHNLKRLEAMLTCSAAEPGMGIGNLEELDGDPWLLGCRNGVVDLKAGSLLAPDPAMRITRMVNAEFQRDATCPTWEEFLRQTFLGDTDTVEAIQRALGYSLTGHVKEEVLHFCHGAGRNGKSVFANVVAKIFADYALTAPADLLMRREGHAASNDIARLAGTRLVLANETRSDQRFDDQTIKILVSIERITARFMYREFFQFYPTFKLWIRGNHKPIVKDSSEGAWRRMRLVPFENNVPEAKADPHLEERLLAERNGILRWMVEGTTKWQQGGLKPSARILAASQQYRDECDLVGEFLTEKCILGPNVKTAQTDLWLIYGVWCGSNGLRSGSKKMFTKRLGDKGILSNAYVNGERAYAGVDLKSSVIPTARRGATTGSHDYPPVSVNCSI